MMQSHSIKIASLLTVPLVFVVAFFALVAPAAQADVACTMEAMQCPDGSYVGRTGPNCAFAACPVAPTPTPVPVCPVFSRDVYYGTTDATTGGQVTKLQAYLAAQGYLSSSSVIGIFGPLTLHAVQSFQRDNGVNTTGYVGVQTRAHIQAKCYPNPQPTSNITIYSVTPTSGSVGTTVSITGFGFTNNNTVHFGSDVIQNVPITSSIAIACTTSPGCHGGINQTIQFTVPSSINPACYYSEPRCLIASQMTAPGSYNVYVENTNGISAPTTFTVTSAQGQGGLNISSLSPMSGVVGTQVTVYGSGFNANDVVSIAGGVVSNVSVLSANQLTFIVPSSIGPSCSGGMICPMYLRLLTPGIYDIAVQDKSAGTTSNSASFTIVDNSGNQSISISGIDAPSTLSLGQSGTWTIHASVPSSTGQLHYSVTWGDEVNGSAQIMAPQPQQIQTSATFTHAYQRSGTYTVNFTVSDDSGHSATASATVLVTPLY